MARGNEYDDDDDDCNDDDDDNGNDDAVMTFNTWPARPLLLFLPIENSYKVVISVKKHTSVRYSEYVHVHT